MMDNNGYWYNISKKYFYIPNTSYVIKITAEEALIIIDDVNLFNWSSYQIFNKTIWKSDINHNLIDVFIREYKRGLLDNVLNWICDNNIECSNVNKEDYLFSLK